MEDQTHSIIDFGQPEDKSHKIIKVIGVGGGGCNAVRNMYEEGIEDVTFAACNTDSKALSHSPVPVRLMLGERGLGVGGNPAKGKEEGEKSIDDIKQMLSDGTELVFVTAGMGGGTGTGAGPIVANIARSMGLLTIGVVTIPFFFEKEKKIIKALKGVAEMRRNVDALLIINNENICDVYSDTHIPVKEAFKRADNVLSNAVKSIAELITVEGNINLDFCDVESTMKNGGEAIMAIGRAKGEHRVEKAFADALNSPLLYGSDISKAKRILFNIYTSKENTLFVDELFEIDCFMDKLDPQIEVIWGISEDDSLGEDAKVAILATGMDEGSRDFYDFSNEERSYNQDEHYLELIKKLYKPRDFKKDKPKIDDGKTDDEGSSPSPNDNALIGDMAIVSVPDEEKAMTPTNEKDEHIEKPKEEPTSATQPTEDKKQKGEEPQTQSNRYKKIWNRIKGKATEMLIEEK